MSTTFDAAPPAPGQPVPAAWQRFAVGAAAVACLGFGAGFTVASLPPPAAPATSIASLAISEATLAGAAADLALRMERLAAIERSVAADRGRLADADALVRAGLALRDALRAGGSYAVPLAWVLALRGGAEALAPWRQDLIDGAAGVPDRAGLAAELDAIALSVQALADDDQARWPSRTMSWLGGLIRSDSRAAIGDRRREAFAASREAATRDALAEAILALDALDADAGAALVGWIEAARRRIALDAMADRVAAAMAAHAYR